MKKYTITIEFTADRKIKFPTEAQLLAAMEAQLESLSDGDFGVKYDITTGDCRIKEEE